MKNLRKINILLSVVVLCSGFAHAQFSDEQLEHWLKKFPQADTNNDGQLTADEIKAFRQKRKADQGERRGGGAPRQFSVDPRWNEKQFPEHAVAYRSPEAIKAVYGELENREGPVITSYKKPSDGSLRIVGTGHSFMAPGYKTFPLITAAAGLEQPSMLLHTSGGITGSARYKWEQENGIFQFDKKPTPKLLASIANAEWDVMMWGPYFNDRPEYYSCWIDFCLKYNPDMKFYLADVWPQLHQLGKIPESEDELTAEVIVQMGKEQEELVARTLGPLREKYPGKVFVLPVCRAMVLAAEYYLRGELPGVEGLHTAVGKKERSLWRDPLGHLGPGFGNLEGYVFYATLYGKSPETIEGDVEFDDPSDYPGKKLDSVFRKIAWEAVTGNALSGISGKED